jgi:alpha-amylase
MAKFDSIKDKKDSNADRSLKKGDSISLQRDGVSFLPNFAYFEKVNMKSLKILLSPLLLLSLSPFFLFSQDLMMQGWYWDYPKTTSGAGWADTIGLKASELGQAGFTYLWAPPLPRASFGNNSNGYDPKDLYDYGEFAGAAGYGTRDDLDSMISALNNAGVELVADMIYNHRDGGKTENNPGLENYIGNFNWTKANNGANPYPYDRMRCILPLGGSTGNTAGHYYFKMSSSSGHSRFHNYEYHVYMNTSQVGWQGQQDMVESEPNGGGDCGQVYNEIGLGRNMNAWIDAGGCTVDEFHLELTTVDFDSAGDTLFIYLGRRNSNYSDMRIYGIWSGPKSMNIVDDLVYQTYTDFSSLPSGQGNMNWTDFKPNNDNSTDLSGDWDNPYFFYDYDQFQEDTKQKLIDWTKWNWNDLGMRGLRMDAVKHFTPEFVGDLLDSLHAHGMDPGLVVGEWYGTNVTELSGWVNSVMSYMEPATQLAIYPRIFDFSLRENLRQSCDNTGFDVRNVFQGSIVDVSGLSGYHVVTFLNNHDFRDNSGFGSLVHNDPILGYVYLLTNNRVGLPCVFYPDYYGYPYDPGTYPYFPSGLSPVKNEIDRLLQIHTKYIFGAPAVEYLNRFSTAYSASYLSGSADKSLIFQVSGGAAGKEVIVAINFSSSTLKVDHGIKMVNGLAPGIELYDIAGNSAWDYTVVNGSNQVYIKLPPRSWSAWVQGNPVEPLAPSGLRVLSASSEKIVLEWRDNSTNEEVFVVERKVGANGEWEILAEVTNFTTDDTEEYTENTALFYRVKAVNSAGSSGYSNEVTTLNHVTWMGYSPDWDHPLNWSHQHKPDQDCDVFIPQSPAGGHFPLLNSGSYGQIRKITIENGAQFEVPSGKTLEITGS